MTNPFARRGVLVALAALAIVPVAEGIAAALLLTSGEKGRAVDHPLQDGGPGPR